MFSQAVDDAVMFGTAYVDGNHCLAHYYDTPLSVYLSDPVRLAARRGTKPPGFDAKIIETAFGIHDVLKTPVDIEFIVCINEQIAVSQVRPISAPHLENWSMLQEDVWDRMIDSGPPTTMVNSIGMRQAKIIDLRQRQATLEDFEKLEENIYLISYGEKHGTSIPAFLAFINAHSLYELSVIVDHGFSIRDSHCQYILIEDPGVDFVANCTTSALPFSDGPCSLESDGFNLHFF
jgi:hypothetical protein